MTLPLHPRDEKRSGWTCHAGGITFAFTAPTRWAAKWRDYLTDYLAEPDGGPGTRTLATYRLNVFAGEALVHEASQQRDDIARTRHIETIPGVVLTETTTTSGQRRYTPAVDALEGQPAAWVTVVDGDHIYVYCRSAEAAPRYVVRVMRELVLRTYENAGGVIFHAAGVDLAGAGVMICGPGSAGKTTTMTALLRSVGGSLLAGDRLILDEHDTVVAVPLPVSAARGTIESVSELRWAARDGWLSRTQRIPFNELPQDFGTAFKIEFSAREYAANFGKSLSSAARLATVVVPRFSDSAEPARLRFLSGDESRKALHRSCFTPQDEFWVAPWLVPRDHADTELAARAERLCDRLASRVSVVEVTFGVHNPIEHLEKALTHLGERIT